MVSVFALALCFRPSLASEMPLLSVGVPASWLVFGVVLVMSSLGWRFSSLSFKCLLAKHYVARTPVGQAPGHQVYLAPAINIFHLYVCGLFEMFTLVNSGAKTLVTSSLRSTRTAATILFLLFLPTVQARCRHCFGVAGEGCDGRSHLCPIGGLVDSSGLFAAGCLTVAGFVRLLSRVEPPNLSVQVTMQILGAAIQSSRLNIFRLNDLTVTRLMQLKRDWPGLSLPVDPIALALCYVTGMKYPVQSCPRELYNRCFEEESTGVKWTKERVSLPPQGLWERVWLETVGRWRDRSTQRESTMISMALDTVPLDSEVEFMEVLYLFYFKHVCVLGLTDHVDLGAFYTIVIHPHLPNGSFGQVWEFANGLLMVCLKRMDTLRHTSFLPTWSDPSGQGLTVVYQDSYRTMISLFPTDDDPDDSGSDSDEAPVKVCSREDREKGTKARTAPAKGYHDFCSMKCAPEQRSIYTWYRDEPGRVCGREGCNDPCWPGDVGYHEFCGNTCKQLQAMACYACGCPCGEDPISSDLSPYIFCSKSCQRVAMYVDKRMSSRTTTPRRITWGRRPSARSAGASVQSIISRAASYPFAPSDAI